MDEIDDYDGGEVEVIELNEEQGGILCYFCKDCLLFHIYRTQIGKLYVFYFFFWLPIFALDIFNDDDDDDGDYDEGVGGDEGFGDQSMDTVVDDAEMIFAKHTGERESSVRIPSKVSIDEVRHLLMNCIRFINSVLNVYTRG